MEFIYFPNRIGKLIFPRFIFLTRLFALIHSNPQKTAGSHNIILWIILLEVLQSKQRPFTILYLI